MRALRRFNEQTKHGNPKTITFTEHRTRFPSRVRDFAEFPLKSGENNKKLGRIITKGKWAGFPIYSLTLEERATCPTSCKQWSICYGNTMPFALRMRWSSVMEKSVSKQLTLLQRKYPKGFVIRLHVLGDFLSEEYAQWWIDQLGSSLPYTSSATQREIGVSFMNTLLITLIALLYVAVGALIFAVLTLLGLRIVTESRVLRRRVRRIAVEHARFVGRLTNL